ncbi:MAG TPA: DUF5678 domain-containing protein [Vicinamibacterales bacterium]|jgi:hypothetical protein
MIEAAEQLGAWAKPPKSENVDVGSGKSAAIRAEPRVRVAVLGQLSISNCLLAPPLSPLTISISLSANTAGSTTGAFWSSPKVPNALLDRFSFKRENRDFLEVTPGILGHDVGSASVGPEAYLTQHPETTVPVREAKAQAILDAAPASQITPYASMIWSLVETQQVRKARALLGLIPDLPEYGRLRKLLSMPVASPSPRTDFDRSLEYQWLSANAKAYMGKWVAVSGNTLLAVGDTLKELRQKIVKLPYARKPLLYYVE